MTIDETRIAAQRDWLQSRLQNAIPALVVNGNLNDRLAGNLHIAIPGIPNSAVIARLRSHLAISTGSACSSGTIAPSHVLQAMNLSPQLIDGSLRLSLGKFTTNDEIEKSADLLIQTIQVIQTLMDEV